MKGLLHPHLVGQHSHQGAGDDEGDAERQGLEGEDAGPVRRGGFHLGID